MNRELQTIGRAEHISLLDLGLSRVPSKIDTGADSSAIWASEIHEDKQGLSCVFFGIDSKYYTGERFHFPPSSYSVTRVANSFGHKEIRYKVKLRIKVKGRVIRATFTLSDRSAKTYPVLLGRRLLSGKFVVDVSGGTPLKRIEKEKAERLAEELKTYKPEGDTL